MTPILISLSSFGATEVRRHGQLRFAQLAHQAGADGVEVRGELLLNGVAELSALAQALPAMIRVYSSPEGLWAPDGQLDAEALKRGLMGAQALGSARLKMSIGGYRPGQSASLARVSQLLNGSGVELVIENDQTATAGTQDALAAFFAAVDAHGHPIGMTFDIGNWHWAGECPLLAAAEFGLRVCYVHCKGVQRDPRRWTAVPLAESAAPWRAVLRRLPVNQPWAIEYPLVGSDLLSVTRTELAQLRDVARSMA